MTRRALALIVTLSAALGAATAEAACRTDAEIKAEKVRVLQTELMVGALKCGRQPGMDMRASYNAFVNRFTPQLIAHAEAMKGYFRRAHGPSYQAHMDRHITEIANMVSSLSNASSGFCADVAARASETLALTPSEIAGGEVGVSLTALVEEGSCAPQPRWTDRTDGLASGGVRAVSAPAQ